jgi:hypothetical protein
MKLIIQKYRILLFSALLIFAGNYLIAKNIEIGQSVLAFWKFNGLYYVGTVVHQEKRADSIVYHVVFEDGDSGIIPSRKVHPLSLGTGSRVLAKGYDKRMHPGIIKKIVGRAIYIHFDDGNRGWTTWSGIAVKAPLNKVMSTQKMSRQLSADL